MYTNQYLEEMMLISRAQEGTTHNFMLNKHSDESLSKPFSSTCLPSIKTLKKFWDKEGKVKPKLDHTCLQALGTLKIIELRLPHFESRVSAGFPASGDDYLDDDFDLITHLIRHPKTTYYVKASGYSMIEAGIFHNDILVVDSSIEPKHGSIVIAVVNGEFTVKRLHKENSQIILVSANPDYPSITITKDMSFFIQGVVTSVIHQFKPLH